MNTGVLALCFSSRSSRYTTAECPTIYNIIALNTTHCTPRPTSSPTHFLIHPHDSCLNNNEIGMFISRQPTILT
jgi:hypothetical protein